MHRSVSRTELKILVTVVLHEVIVRYERKGCHTAARGSDHLYGSLSNVITSLIVNFAAKFCACELDTAATVANAAASAF